MAFGDQINRQTSPRPNNHECSKMLTRFVKAVTPNMHSQRLLALEYSRHNHIL